MSVTYDMSGNDAIFNSVQTGSATAGGTGILIPAFEYASSGVLTATSTSFTLYVNTTLGGTYKIAGASAVFGTASASGTLQVEVATGTQAVGSGTVQLTGTVSLAGTANTVVNGTVIASPTTITAGSRINVILAGTMTSLANGAVTVILQRIS